MLSLSTSKVGESFLPLILLLSSLSVLKDPGLSEING